MPNYILPIGASDDPALVGGKAASLARMSKLGLSVPPGIVITTDYWREYVRDRNISGHTDTFDLVVGIVDELHRLTGKVFCGDDCEQEYALMVSVRSGAPVSMPGMMDTVLNVGLTLDNCDALIEAGASDEWVWATYARFLCMYADVATSEALSDSVKECFQDHDWYGNPYTREMCAEAHKLIDDECEVDDMYEVLRTCIFMVLKSWNSERAIEYRAMHSIPDDLGTAVTIQQMVFGNAQDTRGPSATGVLFSRDPNTGTDTLYGEWLENAQGEDVVAGLRPARNMADMILHATYPDNHTWNDLYDKLMEAAVDLESEYRDMVDIEWTCENGKLWFLQCRPGKRSPEATARIAVDMANERLITQTEAVQRAKPVARLLVKQTLVGNPTPIATGDNSSYGVASGVVVFSSAKAKELAQTVPVVLVRRMTDPQDVGGMNVASAVLTQEGGPSSHAAVVARELGKPCVTNASIQLDTTYFEANGERYSEGDWLTVDGTSGYVYAGQIAFETTNDNPYLATLKEWGL